MELLKNEYQRYSLLAQTEQLREETQTVIVPDTQADVYGVLQVNAVCQLKQKLLRQDAVVLEGVIEAEAVCVTEDETACQFVRLSMPFSQEYSLPGCTENGIVQVRLEAVRAEALLRNPRKLQLQVQTSAELRLYDSCTLTVVEGAAGAPDEGMELLTEPCELELLRCVAEKKLMAADELRLERPGHLLRCAAQWKQEELRLLTNKVMLRGEVALQAVFLAEGELWEQTFSLPYSQVVECESAEAGDQAEADYATLQMQVGLTEGEAPVLSCNVTGCVWVRVKKRLRLNILQDAYSTGWETGVRTEELDCPAFVTEERQVPVSESFSADEPIERLVDCDWRARGAVEEGGRLCGVYRFRLLYRTEGRRLRALERTVRVASDEPVGLTDAFCQATLQQMAVHVGEDGQIVLRFTAVLQARGARAQRCTQVCECRLDREKPRALPPAGTLVLRNVAEGETVWSIARGCGAKREDILAANQLDSAGLVPGKLILIPFSR